VFPHKPATSPRKFTSILSRYHRARKRRLQPYTSTAAKRFKKATVPSAQPQEITETHAISASLATSTSQESLLFELHRVQQERNAAFLRLHQLEQYPEVMSAASVANDDIKCQNTTGLKWTTFMCLFSFVSSFIVISSSVTILPIDQLFVTLVKLRHNPSFSLLAHTACLSKATVISFFWKWIDSLYKHIGFLVRWPDREEIYKVIPAVFKSKFPRLTSIIDCFEIFTDAPKNLHARAQCWSNYKKHCTIKVFICCNPLGSITFLSPVWGGRASDVKIVRESGFIDSQYHLPGDQILADRGFTLHDDFASVCSAELITPAFTKGKKQLSAQEVELSRHMSSVRIHVERVIGVLKNRYTILKGPLPISMIKSLHDEAVGGSLSSCDKLVHVCAALVNLSPSIVIKKSK